MNGSIYMFAGLYHFLCFIFYFCRSWFLFPSFSSTLYFLLPLSCPKALLPTVLRQLLINNDYNPATLLPLFKHHFTSQLALPAVRPFLLVTSGVSRHQTLFPFSPPFPPITKLILALSSRFLFHASHSLRERLFFLPLSLPLFLHFLDFSSSFFS